MAKLDGQTAIKYLAMGAGAVAVPAIVGNFGTISDMLVKIPLWGQAIYAGITVGGLVMAGLGVGLVDHFGFSK